MEAQQIQRHIQGTQSRAVLASLPEYAHMQGMDAHRHRVPICPAATPQPAKSCVLAPARPPEACKSFTGPAHIPWPACPGPGHTRAEKAPT